MILLLVVYVLSRSVCGWLADHPERYRGAATDIGLYEYWADRIVRDGDLP
jgi:hypothetical protein